MQSLTASKSISGFDPRSIPGIALWLDAADSSVISFSSGSNISAWKDKSGNGYICSNAVGTSTLAQNSLNGFASVYTAASILMQISGFAWRTKFVAFIVGRSAAGNYLIGHAGGGNRTYVFTGNNNLLNVLASSELNLYDSVNALSTSVTGTNPFMLAIGYDNTTNTNANPYTVNGKTRFTRVNGASAVVTDQTITNTFYINSLGGNTYDSVNTGEILIYNNTLSTSQCQRIEGYLANKWGLVGSLPRAHPNKYTKPFSRLFDVLTDGPSGLALWLDAADTSTITGSTTVTAWNDKSGNGRNLSVLAGTTSYSTYESRPSIKLNASSMFVYSDTDLTNYTVFYVGLQQNSATNHTVFIGIPASASQIDSNSSDGFGLYIDPAQYRFYGGLNANYSLNSISSSSSNNIPLTIMSYTQSSVGVLSSYVNGASGSTSTVTSSRTNTCKGFAIGGSGRFESINQNPVCTANISEILVYTSVLTTPQRQQIEGYLAAKWKIVAPFALLPPDVALPFTPNMYGGLAAWFDGADNTSQSMTFSGTSITVWKDKSGNDRDATASNGPVVLGANGGVVLASSGYFAVPGLSGALVTTPFTIFIVESGNSGWLFGDDISGGTRAGLFIGVNSSAVYFNFYSDDISYGALGGADPHPIRLWCFRLGLSARQIRLNGTSIASGNNNQLTAFVNPTIGRVFGGNYFTGTIFEMLVYNSDYNDEQIMQIEASIAWKWGLQTSLPAPAPAKVTLNPATVSGIVIRSDATAITGATNGSAITTWVNSGNGGTINCGGTYITNGLGTKPVVRLNTSQQWSPVSAPILNNYTMFWVGRQRGGTNGRVLSHAYNNQLYGYWNGQKRALYIDGNPQNLSGFGGQGGQLSSDSEWDLMSHSRTAGGAYMMNWNGAALFSGTSSTGNPLTGIQINTYEASDCEIAEFILYDSVLTSTQVYQIENFLQSKWGVGAYISNPYTKIQPGPATVIVVAPASPTGFTLTLPVGANPYTNWTASSGAVNYNVKLYNSANTLLVSNITSGTTTTFVFTMTNGDSYYATIVANNSGGSSALVTTATATYSLPIPNPPTGLSLSMPPGANSTASWTASATSTSYTARLYNASGPTLLVTNSGLTGTSTTFVSTLVNANNYYFTVTATNSTGTSSPAQSATSTYSLPVPVAPTNLSLGTFTGSAVSSWTAPATATSYNAYLYSSPSGTLLESKTGITASTTTFAYALTVGAQYYFTVAGINSTGTGALATSSTGTYVQYTIFSATGSYQYYTVPAGKTQIYVVAWGGGGGGVSGYASSYGGGGACVKGYLPVTAGERLTIVVGYGSDAGASRASTDENGGGGSGNGRATGGGRTAIQRTAGTDIFTVGGGGCGGMGYNSGGAATASGAGCRGGDQGQTTSNNGSQGGGGGQSSGGQAGVGSQPGVDGSKGFGGRGAVGNGGGGWYGGGGSGFTYGQDFSYSACGGGGSSYIDNLSTTGRELYNASETTPGNSSDPMRAGTYGQGAQFYNQNGGNGILYISA